MAFPLILAASRGFRASSVGVTCVLRLWVMNTILSFIVRPLPLYGNATLTCSLVPLGLSGSSFGRPICVQWFPSFTMPSRLVQTFIVRDDLAATPFFFLLLRFAPVQAP